MMKSPSTRGLVIAAAAAVALAVAAAVGMAGTSATPNGCPTDKSAKTAPIADLSPPARLQIVAFDVLSASEVGEARSRDSRIATIPKPCSQRLLVTSPWVAAPPHAITAAA